MGQRSCKTAPAGAASSWKAQPFTLLPFLLLGGGLQGLRIWQHTALTLLLISVREINDTELLGQLRAFPAHPDGPEARDEAVK